MVDSARRMQRAGEKTLFGAMSRVGERQGGQQAAKSRDADQQHLGTCHGAKSSARRRVPHSYISHLTQAADARTGRGREV